MSLTLSRKRSKLDRVLEDGNLLIKFEQFLRERHCYEYLSFLRASQAFQAMLVPQERVIAAKSICGLFISQQVQSDVNFEPQTRESLQRNLNAAVTAFNDADGQPTSPFVVIDLAIGDVKSMLESAAIEFLILDAFAGILAKDAESSSSTTSPRNNDDLSQSAGASASREEGRKESLSTKSSSSDVWSNTEEGQRKESLSKKSSSDTLKNVEERKGSLSSKKSSGDVVKNPDQERKGSPSFKKSISDMFKKSKSQSEKKEEKADQPAMPRLPDPPAAGPVSPTDAVAEEKKVPVVKRDHMKAKAFATRIVAPPKE